MRAPDRATVRRELVPDRIWSFEQVQGLIYVHVPVRMVVVKLDSGGLFAYSTVAPTDECLRLLSELEAAHGPLRHILLPTSALEHKYFAGAFAGARPDAQLWVAPFQYSFPLDLPLVLQGFPSGTRVLPLPSGGLEEGEQPEWAAQLPYKALGPIKERVGGFQEVVCYDSATRTLLVTDLIVSVPEDPPEVVRVNDERALRFHSRDSPADSAEATAEALRVGWRKICLFALYFQSSPLEVASPPDGTPGGALRFLESAFPAEVPKEARALGWNGFIAWSWRPEWRRAFDALRAGGAPLVPPIIQVAILNREPETVLRFVEEVADAFSFTRIVPCHFDAPVKATPAQWREAFNFLRRSPIGGRWGRRARAEQPDADLAFLRSFEQGLVRAGSIRPPKPKI